MILVGTCGFQHRDWVQVFYPRDLAPGAWLAYYSLRFECCELGFTSYRIPEPFVFQQLVDGSNGRLQFVVRAPAVLVNRDPDPEPAARFVSAVSPLAEAGQLAGILAAFGPEFGFNRENFARLCAIRDSLPRATLIAEFGCSDWLTGKAARHLGARNVALACIDGAAEGSEMPYRSAATPAYVRFQGRNHSKWLPGDGSAQHDYLYTCAELESAATRLRRLEGECGQVLVLLNNVWRGQAAMNAQMLQKLLGKGR